MTVFWNASAGPLKAETYKRRYAILELLEDRLNVFRIYFEYKQSLALNLPATPILDSCTCFRRQAGCA